MSKKMMLATLASSAIAPLRNASQVWINANTQTPGLINGELMPTLVNGGQLPDVSQPVASFQPAFETDILDGKPAIAADGIGDRIPFASLSSLEFVWATGIFEMAFVARFDGAGANRPLLGNTIAAASKGFMVQAHATGVGRFFITTGAATAAVVSTPGAITPGAWGVIGVRGDGANVDISLDLTTYTTAARGVAYVPGDAAAIPTFFGNGEVLTPRTDGAMALAGVWDRELTSDERATLRTYINDTWGFSL